MHGLLAGKISSGMANSNYFGVQDPNGNFLD